MPFRKDDFTKTMLGQAIRQALDSAAWLLKRECPDDKELVYLVKRMQDEYNDDDTPLEQLSRTMDLLIAKLNALDPEPKTPQPQPERVLH